MLCPKCKEQLKDGTKICPFCGTDIKAALSACTAQANLSGRPHKFAKAGKGIAIFIITFFVFSVVVIAGGYFLLKNIFSIWG